MKKMLYSCAELTGDGMMELLLRREGIAYEVFRDANEACRRLRSGHFGLVVVDQTSPSDNGDTVLKEIRAHAPEVPMIALTADDSVVPQLREAGYDRIFIKPLRGNGYISTIRQYLRSA